MFIFQILTIFPERYHAYFSTGMPKRAIQKGIAGYSITNLLDFAIVKNKKKIIDGKPYGGGPGRILRIEPVDRALSSIEHRFPVIAMTPGGILLTQKFLQEFYQSLNEKNIRGLTLLSGYYEGFDQRILDNLVDVPVSIGKFILNSGDVAILCFLDAFLRLIPGFLNNEESLREESFSGILPQDTEAPEFPQYTKPREYKGWKVPEVLLSGNHSLIDRWRKEKILELIAKRKQLQEHLRGSL